MNVTAHRQGTPSWIELSAGDESAALDFYSALFGWSDDPRSVPEGPDYHMQLLGGDPVAGISAQQPAEATQGIPPHWNLFLTVEDLDAVAAEVAGAGGSTVVAPFDVMDMGRMAVIADPTGAAVCLWEAKAHIGAERLGEPGALAWAELGTSDPERAATFFADLLDYEVKTNPMPEGEPYTVLSLDGEDVAGIYKLGAEMGNMPAAWLAYIAVEDVDASTERVQALGGQVLMPPMDIPGGRCSVVRDPQQAVFGLWRAGAS